jgi:uncharacterized BrkB/YihY/UPF0761 family membrane protein
MLERIQLGKGWAHCRRWLGSAWELTNQTLDGFSKDRGDLLAAALAYYSAT